MKKSLRGITIIALTTSIIIALAITLIINITTKIPSSSYQKKTPYECGFDPITISRISFSSRFFLIATIFLIFDGELSLIMPIALPYNLNFSYFLTFSIFISILIFGLL
ncbi:NADH-quinone oxidoreductase subunit A [Escherichia coli]|nr:NADH-quinone oxidoreductase subunit A [Escherichia coli]